MSANPEADAVYTVDADLSALQQTLDKIPGLFQQAGAVGAASMNNVGAAADRATASVNRLATALTAARALGAGGAVPVLPGGGVAKGLPSPAAGRRSIPGLPGPGSGQKALPGPVAGPVAGQVRTPQLDGGFTQATVVGTTVNRPGAGSEYMSLKGDRSPGSGSGTLSAPTISPRSGNLPAPIPPARTAPPVIAPYPKDLNTGLGLAGWMSDAFNLGQRLSGYTSSGSVWERYGDRGMPAIKPPSESDEKKQTKLQEEAARYARLTAENTQKMSQNGMMPGIDILP